MKNCINCGANNFKVIDNYFVCTYCGSVVIPVYEPKKNKVTIQDLRKALNKNKDIRGGVRL